VADNPWKPGTHGILKKEGPYQPSDPGFSVSSMTDTAVWLYASVPQTVPRRTRGLAWADLRTLGSLAHAHNDPQVGRTSEALP
jgi:hypothetical protein